MLQDGYQSQCCGKEVVSDKLTCCGNVSKGQAFVENAENVCCGNEYVPDKTSVCCTDELGRSKVKLVCQIERNGCNSSLVSGGCWKGWWNTRNFGIAGSFLHQ